MQGATAFVGLHHRRDQTDFRERIADPPLAWPLSYQSFATVTFRQSGTSQTTVLMPHRRRLLEEPTESAWLQFKVNNKNPRDIGESVWAVQANNSPRECLAVVAP